MEGTGCAHAGAESAGAKHKAQQLARAEAQACLISKLGHFGKAQSTTGHLDAHLDEAILPSTLTH